jgi:spore coat protein U-like protein
VFLPFNFRSIGGGLALLLIAASPAALAQNATLNVSATVDASCDVNGGTLEFGSYNAASEATGEATFTYSCTGGPDITVTLGSGQSPQDGNRAMVRAGGGDTLSYQLFKNAARDEPWGLGSDGIDVSVASTDVVAVDVYGLIAAGQNVPAGDYSDSVQITLTINP